MAVLISTSLLLAAAHSPSPALSDRDFDQLMTAAVAASSTPADVQPLTATICVQSELAPPLEYSRAAMATLKDAGQDARPLATGDAEADKALSEALSPGAAVAPQVAMPPLPRRFVLFGKRRPSECLVRHGMMRGPNWKHDESIVALNFTRPALANGYAFVNEYEDCAGLCGTTFLRAFRKRHGKWTQVGRTILSVS